MPCYWKRISKQSNFSGDQTPKVVEDSLEKNGPTKNPYPSKSQLQAVKLISWSGFKPWNQPLVKTKKVTLPETNSKRTWKWAGCPKRKLPVVFQPSKFSGAMSMLVSGSDTECTSFGASVRFSSLVQQHPKSPQFVSRLSKKIYRTQRFPQLNVKSLWNQMSACATSHLSWTITSCKTVNTSLHHHHCELIIVNRQLSNQSL